MDNSCNDRLAIYSLLYALSQQSTVNMVFCAVYGCSHRNERDKCSFFRIPTVKKSCTEKLKDLIKKRRHMWILRINRKDFTDMKANFSRVCSDHFVSGRPSKLRDINSPDWAPSLNLGYDKMQFGKSVLSTYNRVVNQAEKVTNSTLIENQRDSVEEKSCDSVSDSSTLTASISNGEEEKSDEPEIETICDISSTKSISPSKRKSRNLNGIRNCSDVEKNSDIEDTEKGIRNCSDVEKNSDIEDTEKDIRNCSDVEKNSDIEDIEKGIRNCSDVEKSSDIEDIEKTRKKRKVNCLSPPENMMDVPEVLSDQNNFHREDIFGHYVVSELRALKDNPLLYLQTKQSILEILTSAHLEYLNPPE